MPQAPHVPDEVTRRTVTELVVAGVNQDGIGRVLGIDEKTLRKHYATELAIALDEVTGRIVGTLIRKALDGDTASICFFLKARAKKYGWTERHEVTGAEGGPIRTEDVSGAREHLLSRIGGVAARSGEGGGS